MGNRIEQVNIPDIGGAENVDVIEVFVKVGDEIKVDDPLLTLEGDKATMDVPSPLAGKIKDLQVKVGDKVSEGAKVLTIESAGDSTSAEKETPKPAPVKEQAPAKAAGGSQTLEVKVPDIGGAENVDVIDVMVKAGDKIQKEDPLITMEGDKATMDVPAPDAGEVAEVKVKVGDKVSEGSVILMLKTASGGAAEVTHAPSASAVAPKTEAPVVQPPASAPVDAESFDFGTSVHAGPAVRRIAREFGVNLTKINGTGNKGRITKEDVQQFVKSQLRVAQSGGGGGVGLNLAPAPKIDFAKFGEIEKQSLNKIKKITGLNMARNWVTIPHVTQFGETDITELEAFRKQEKTAVEKEGIRLTPLVFIMKAAVAALKAYPNFNSSLSEDGSDLILKKYFHIGVAVDTPKGLVVPVIRDVDKKSLKDLARELGEISIKARDKGLSVTEMQGGCFTISSLGGIGGTAFTPIINAPEVSILGVSRTETKPVFIEGEFQPRLMLPLSLSYDHRVIDGADGARFLMHLCKSLSDIRTLLL